jgi:hypothetical protein
MGLKDKQVGSARGRGHAYPNGMLIDR